ncbi:MAG: hypothetical protein ACRDLD_02440 [Thermoleophilaceae bacterium]
MAYSTPRATLGGKDVRKTSKRPKVRRKKPKVQTPNAVLGGEGVRKAQAAAKRAKKAEREAERAAKRASTSARAILGGEGVAKEKKAARKAKRSARERKHRRQSRALVKRLEEPAAKQFRVRAERQKRKGIERGEIEPPDEDESSFAERLLAGGVVGLVDEEASAAARKALYGSEDPSATQVALGILPTGRALAPLRVVKAVTRGSKAAKATTGVAKTEARAAKRSAGQKVKPVTKGQKGRPRRKAAKKARAKREGRTRKVPRSKAEAKVKVRRAKAETKARYSRAGRSNRRVRRAQTVAQIGAGAPAVAGTAAAVGATTATAIKEDVQEGKPLRTIKTTGRVLPSIAAGVVGTAKDVVDAARTGSLEPLEGELEAQKHYWETVARVAEGDTKAVQEDVGLIPVISGGLTGLAFAKPFKGAAKAPKAPRAARDIESPDPAKRRRAKAKVKRETQRPAPALRRHRERKGTAEEVGMTGERERAVGAAEMREARLDKTIAKLGRKKIADDVSLADTLQILMRRGHNPDDPEGTLKRLRAHRAGLRASTAEIDPDDLATRVVLDALIRKVERDPDVLADTDLREALAGLAQLERGRSEELHRERLGPEAKGPDPQLERARLMHVAREKEILLPEERQARRTRYRKLRGRGMPATEAFSRASRAASRENAQREARREGQQVFRKAEGLEREATRLEGEGLRAEAQDLRQQAMATRRKQIATNERANAAFIEETLQAIERDPAVTQPTFAREIDVSDQGRLNVLGDFPGGKVPAKIKRRRGVLAEQGRIDESAAALFHNLYATRRAMELRRMWRDFANRERLKINSKTVFTGPQARKLERGGAIPRGYTVMPVQQFERTLARGKWEQLAGMTTDEGIAAMRRELHDAKQEKGKKYIVVPEEALREIGAQMAPPRTAVRRLRVLGHIQSALILATSPAWFAFQLVASPFAALVAHPNPILWARAAKQVLTDWRQVPRTHRAAFRAHFGGTSTDVLMRRQTATGLEPDTVRNFSRAAEVAQKTPAGRALRAVGEQVKRGGPLMKANREYEGWVRTMTALVENQKALRQPRVKSFLADLAGLDRKTSLHTERLRKLSFPEQVSYYARHPEAAEEIARGVRDTLGDWVTLSSRERGLAAVTVFYPFLRFSLRWAFVSLPRRHPIKAMILLNLAQQNAQELEELLGGPPSLFTKYGLAVTHSGQEGEPIKAIDTARFNPGANALIEAIGGGSRDMNLATLARPLQPAIGTALAAVGGYDPFTGEPTSEPATTLIARQLLGLSPISRAYQDELGLRSDSAVAKLFRKIADQDLSLAESTLPVVVRDLRRERQSAALGRLLDASEKPEISGIIREQIVPAVEAGADAKRTGRRQGRRAASQIRDAQEASDELQRILRAEGLADDPATQQAIDEFFSLVTPAQFGQEPAEKEDGAGAYDEVFGGGERSRERSGAFEEVFNGEGRSSRSRSGGAFEQVFGD